MPHYDWNKMPSEPMSPLVSRKAIHAEVLTVARVQLAQGAVLPPHSHVHEQVAVVERGAIRFNLDGQEVLVRAGQALAIPSGVPHGVEALEDSEVIDIFSPRRQDWIDGDSSYLRR